MRQAFERDTFLRGASLGAVTAVLAFLIYGLVFGGEGLGRFLLAALLAGAITNGVSVMLERRRRQRPDASDDTGADRNS